MIQTTKSEEQNEETTNSIINDTTKKSCENECKDIGLVWKRNCPKCNKEIQYSEKLAFNFAMRKNSKCISCNNYKRCEDWLETKKLLIPKNYLENEYLILDKTLREIAIDNNVCSQTISKLLKLYGIKTKTKIEIAYNKIKDIIGKRFNNLVILKIVKSKNRESMLECKCDCGNIKIIKKRFVLNGDCKSCGCLWKCSCYKEIPGYYFNVVKNNAESRNLEYNLTKEYLWDLYEKQNRKCALSGVDIIFCKDVKTKKQTTSLDRIDSSKGYTKDNVQWVHKDVNSLKSNFPETDLFYWVEKIYVYRIGK